MPSPVEIQKKKNALLAVGQKRLPERAGSEGYIALWKVGKKGIRGRGLKQQEQRYEKSNIGFVVRG